ncbi:MAG TPA: efflux RND transporter periplasmic adaptor subunit [Xanthobacteraceae bacterium]|nr:efflux RND transporter periplasmic adaptor subunit [Xanthobacteraceae bacterium]
MRNWTVIAISLLAVGLALYLSTARGSIPFLTPAATQRPPPIPVPVSAAVAQRQDVPIYLTGLGTVQAYNSVIVKSRVDGQIVKINFSEGKDVRTGDVLVEIDPRPYEAALSQAQANKLKDEAQLENARLDFERLSNLIKTNAVSKQQLDAARALLGQLEATVKADQAAIDMAQTQLDYTKIRSPIDGRAGTRLIDIGNVVRTTDTGGIVTINQLNPIFVNFALPADSLPPVRARLKQGDVPVTAQDSNLVDLSTGTLSVIDNQVNAATGTVTYKATFANGDEVLWPGQFVNVRVELEVRRDVLALPVRAVQQGPDGPFVFVVGPTRVVDKRTIKVGLLNKTTAIVDAGLQPGEIVVTDGQYRIQKGAQVDILANAADAPGRSAASQATQ